MSIRTVTLLLCAALGSTLVADDYWYNAILIPLLTLGLDGVMCQQIEILLQPLAHDRLDPIDDPAVQQSALGTQ